MNWLSEHDIIIAYPHMLWLLLLLPLFIWYFVAIQKKHGSTFQVSATTTLQKVRPSWRVRARWLLPVLLGIAYIAAVLGLSRPQQTNTTETITNEGIDIVLSLDISGSMLAEDFHPNRIEAAKKTAIAFVADRPTDRIGLVLFAGESFTQCPITIDHNVLIDQIEVVKSGMLQDGTAIGMGLGTAVARLRHAKGKSKVVILMTDGVNNTGKIDPQTALELAKTYPVRVYCIGIGTEGEALYPVPTPMGIQKQMVPVQIDEALLKEIANETGGRYYRATDNASLEKIYSEIDKLEKTKIEMQAYREHKELFFPFALVAFAALALHLILRFTLFRSLTH